MRITEINADEERLGAMTGLADIILEYADTFLLVLSG